MKEFVNICKMSAETLKIWLTTKLQKMYGTENVVATKGTGYIYAKGDFPVLLVAHLDTVHNQLPKHIVYDKAKTTIRSVEGIGGDDRCGVYMILQLIHQRKCSVLFCDEEEVGGIGAKQFTKDYPHETFNYIMEFDRMNATDAVFYDCDNPAFESFITKHYYKTSFGSFSDISIIAPALGVAAVNLSCGYYKAHTLQEYVNMGEMHASINAALGILQDTDVETDKYEYIPYKSTRYDFDDDYYYSIGKEEGLYRIEYGIDGEFMDEYAVTQFAAIGMFLYDNPTLTYNDIKDIYLVEDTKLW